MRARKITTEHLISDYVRLKKTLGRMPTSIEFARHSHSISLLSGAFGRPGWKKFLQAVGEKPLRPLQLTRAQVVKAYLDLKKELGRTPTAAEYAEKYYSNAALRKVFGSFGWNNLLRAAGERPRRAAWVTRTMLIEEYQALKKKLGRQPLLTEYQKACYGVGIVTAKFGSRGWRRLLEAAGDKPLVGYNLPARHLIADFLDLQEKLRRRPKLIEYTYQCHTPKVLDRVFGKPGWRKLIDAVGKKAMPKNILTAEHLLQDYREIRKALGRDPLQDEFRERHGHTTKVLDRLFGKPGWRNFQKAARRAGRR